MKIYCILNDSIPLGNRLETYLKNKGFHHFTQISNYFTTTSAISLLTGKLPSDLEKGGIGYHTHFNYKVNNKTEYPWKERLLTHDLHKKGWGIHFHNANWFYLTICDDNFIQKTTSMPCSVEKEEEFRATKDYDKILLDGNSDYYSKEKEFIQKIQNEKTDKNQFYFIKNNQYHESLVRKTNKEEALELIEKWMGYWDFEEENAIFWFFSDHHDFTKIDKLCKAPSMLTWATLKWNFSKKLNIKKNYIHIKDFSQFKFEGKEDRNRIYFTEDARCEENTQVSTTAVACKFIDWAHNKAKRLLQVTYYFPEDQYYGFIYNLDTKKLEPCIIKSELKEALKRRFKWIP